MATTSRGIVYPVVGDNLTPLANHFANLATSTNTALGTLEGKVPYLVNDAADRDTRYPAPVQGTRVYRLDTGVEEIYLSTYNSSTNPTGASPAGWYGPTEYARVTMASDMNTNATNVDTPLVWAADSGTSGLWNSGAANRVTIKRPGLYLIKFSFRVPALGSGEYVIGRVALNGSATTFSENLATGGQPGGGYVTVVDSYRINPGSYVQAIAASSPGVRSINYNNASMFVERIGA